MNRRIVLVVAALAIGGLAACGIERTSLTPGEPSPQLQATEPDELATLDVHGFKLDHPIAWDEYTYRGICLVEGCPRWALAQPPIPAACRTSEDDLNCVGEMSLASGAIRVEFSQRTIDAPGLQGLVGRRSAGESVTETTVGGMPALEIFEHDQQQLAFLHADERVTWIVQDPAAGPPPQAIVIVAIVRSPGVDRRVAQLRAMVASLVFAGAGQQRPVSSIPVGSSIPRP